MTPQDKSRLGSDPLSWIKKTVVDETEETENEDTKIEDPEENKVIEEESKRRVGRPQTIKREITISSQEGLPINWTRATFIVNNPYPKGIGA